jgi:3-deoxy-manno-octulosonate cytidylyltransferase (CMP-KDO synthetase)
MSFSVIIPARYASTRLPGKPLADIAGKPMLQHVWERARRSSASAVIIATDDPRVQAAAEAWGAQVCMTRAEHVSGTDRLQEVVQSCGLADEEVVVNVQGDEPLIPPAVIEQVAANLERHASAGVATLCTPITSPEALRDPNVVKVVSDCSGFALYFSRAPIPFPRGLDLEGADAADLLAQGQWRRHIGLYAYRVGFLHRFVTWPQAPQERLEQLEQLRALHRSERIHVDSACEDVPAGVDTAEDLEQVRRRFADAAS